MQVRSNSDQISCCNKQCSGVRGQHHLSISELSLETARFPAPCSSREAFFIHKFAECISSVLVLSPGSMMRFDAPNNIIETIWLTSECFVHIFFWPTQEYVCHPDTPTCHLNQETMKNSIISIIANCCSYRVILSI